MEPKGCMLLNALLNHYHPGSEEALLQYLPEEERALIAEYPAKCSDTKQLVLSADEVIDKIHYSWLLPAIRTYPEALQPFLIGSLPPEVQKRLSDLGEQIPTPVQVAPKVQQFFLRKIVEAISEAEILPAPLIPHTALTPLLNCSKGQLIEVIDLLGIHDLAAEFSQIIDAKLLRTLEEQLSPKKQQYLKVSIQKPPHSLAEAPLPLHALNGDPRKLEIALHRKGLARLGTAMAGSDASFLWHVTHTLDAGRAQILTRFLSKPEATQAAATMATEVVHVIKFLNKQG